MKLNIGCGGEKLDGYINIDSDSSFNPDLILDLRNLSNYFKPDSIDEILMVHVIGYLSLWECEEFLQDAHKILRPNGTLIIETPNFDKCVQKVDKDFDNYLEAVRGIVGFGLDHFEDKKKYVPYSFSWNAIHLSNYLKVAGFKSIKILPPTSHVMWRDMRIEASKRERSAWKKIKALFSWRTLKTKIY